MTSPLTSARLEAQGFDASGLAVIALEGREAVSEPFRFVVTLLARDAAAAPSLDELAGAEASVVLGDGEREARRFAGIVTEASRLPDTERGYAVLELVLAPRLARAELVQNVRVNVDADVLETVRDRLRRVGLDEPDVEIHVRAKLARRPMLVQWRETDFAFVSRLLEHHGLAYYFTSSADGDRLVIADHAAAFVELASPRVPYRARGERRDVYEIKSTRALVKKNFVCRDYNDKQPTVALQSEKVSLAEGDAGGVFDYGLNFTTEAEGTQLARALADHELARRDVLEGKSDVASFAAGHRFTLEGHGGEDRELVLTEVTHALVLREAEGESPARAEYSNRFRAIPAGRVPRPARKTPVPRIHGAVHAVVQTDAAGTVGKIAELDAEGRYLIKFRFDSAAQGDAQAASCRVRMLQSSAGTGYGTHFPLRPGVEVLVAFEYGDPDRPVILGAVPNAITPSPVTGTGAGKNRIRTQSGAMIEIDDGT